jgi:hypothetical protein
MSGGEPSAGCRGFEQISLDAREAEVEQLDAPSFQDKDVTRLEVTNSAPGTVG